MNYTAFSYSQTMFQIYFQGCSSKKYQIGNKNYNFMKNYSTQAASTNDLFISNQKISAENPARAATRLKDLQNNILVMKNRHIALQVKDQYHKYKTIDQERRINYHTIIHEKMLKDREVLRKSLDEIRDTKEIKQRSQQLKLSIHNGLQTARNNLQSSNSGRYSQIMQESLQNNESISHYKQSDLDTNRNRKLSIKREQQEQKDIIRRKLIEKMERAKLNKTLDVSRLEEQAKQSQKILQKLSTEEGTMVSLSSRSQEASREMSHRYNQIMANLPSLKGRKQCELPTLKPTQPQNKGPLTFVFA